ncbi:uncharacterized protein LOC105703913 [Orussus abietinus]|uniref:uncharacterized protein LOC105703913 n=1 Tax=Orussus abietinus TaxID=222816 RepID=UPI0006268DD2|nr:uncharacterized protein LOC105703913 [Orussus abietinus]XP_012288122.1 uncharacterized protein LOC105703913 [Orussus abietinus]
MNKIPQREPPGRYYSRNKVRLVPTLKWERQLPSSKPYWERVCKEVEDKVRRVRFPFPISSISSNCSFSYQNRISLKRADKFLEPVVHISPPTPQHKPQEELYENNIQSDETRDNVKKKFETIINIPLESSVDGNTNFTSFSLNEEPQIEKSSLVGNNFGNERKIFSSRSCPFHKNQPPLRIFDDDLKRVLPKSRKSKQIIQKQTAERRSLSALEFRKRRSKKIRPINDESLMDTEVRISLKSGDHAARSKESDLNEMNSQMISEDSLEQETESMNKLKCEPSESISEQGDVSSEQLDEKAAFRSRPMREVRFVPSTKIQEELGGKINDELQPTSKRMFFSTEDTSPRLTRKVPKLGTVSLHQSFSKAVSFDSTEDSSKHSNEKTDEPDVVSSPEENLNMRSMFQSVFPALMRVQKLLQKKLQRQRRKNRSNKLWLKAATSCPGFYKASARNSSHESGDKGSSMNSHVFKTSQNHDDYSGRMETSLGKDQRIDQCVTVSSSKESMNAESNIKSAIETEPKGTPLKPDPNEISYEEEIIISKMTEHASQEIKDVEEELERTLSISQQSRKPVFLKRSIRYAYRALKFLTANKKLEFFPRIAEASPKSPSTLSSGASTPTREVQEESFSSRRASSISYDSIVGRLRQNAPKYLGSKYEFPEWKSIVDVRTKTITTSTRSTSGSSPEFQKTTLRSPSDAVLSGIPKMCAYPRRTCDRCLCCLYKTFEKPLDVKRELPLAVLKSFVNDPGVKILDSEASSVSVPAVEIPQLDERSEQGSGSPHRKVETVRFFSTVKIIKSMRLLDGSKARSSQPGTGAVTIPEQSLSPKNSQASQQESHTLSISSSRSKASTGSGQSSEEEAQVQIEQTVPAPKYFVPSYVPLNLTPSLDQLRALKLRKATPMSERGATPVNAMAGSDASSEDETEGKRNKALPSTVRSGVSKRDPKVGPGNQVRGERARLLADADEFSDGSQKAQSSIDSLAAKVATMMSLGGRISTATRVEVKGTPPGTNLKPSQFGPRISFASAGVTPRGETLPGSKGSGGSSPIDPSSWTSKMELDDLLESCLERDRDVLQLLYSVRDELLHRDPYSDGVRSVEIATNLVELLLDSRMYLFPDDFPSDLKFSKQPILCRSRVLRRALPLTTYNTVAPILGVPRWIPKLVPYKDSLDERNKPGAFRPSSGRTKFSRLTYDLTVHPPSRKGGSTHDEDKEYQLPRLSPYAVFLTKPRRKAITWRPLSESDLKGYDPEATLNMRSTRVTNKICSEFCEWLRSLGGADEGIDEEVLRDMFRIDFNIDANRTTQMKIEEMPTVPSVVAHTRNRPDATELALTKMHLIRDAKAEKREKKTVAFGTTLPDDQKFLPPRNKVWKRWLQCESVPKDLETMDFVWDGITHLDSVKGFVEWLETHSNVTPPKALKAAVMSPPPIGRQSREDDTFANLELDLDQIRSLKVDDNDRDMSGQLLFPVKSRK